MAERKKARKEKEEAPKKKAAPRKKKEPAHAPAPVVEAKPQIAPAPQPAAVPVHAAKPSTPPKFRVPSPKFYGTGRRKESVAKVWITSGSGKVTVNGKPMSQFFCGRRILEFVINRPFNMTQTQGKYDVYAETLGGGVSGQAGAVGVGIAHALIELNPDLRSILRRNGLVTRDPRMKERKKYGRKRARRAFQYTKR
jgi:small subunit ribosomal protein S9